MILEPLRVKDARTKNALSHNAISRLDSISYHHLISISKMSSLKSFHKELLSVMCHPLPYFHQYY